MEPHHGAALPVGVGDRVLAQDLEGSVVAVDVLAGGVLDGEQLGVLGELILVEVVDRSGRREEVPADVVAQKFRRVAHMAGDVAAVVDHGVPGAAAQRVELVVTVADQRLHAGEELGVGAAAVEERDVVPPVHGVAHHVGADEPGASQDEDLEGAGGWAGVGGAVR